MPAFSSSLLKSSPPSATILLTKLFSNFSTKLLFFINNINNDLKVVWDAGNGATGNILKKMITF